ncbi:hypothetical protein BC828DRAFT_386005 [Blastocladiella britannica]|nr:hypothetical protein BC828DRAFT_386005 [Blastocladiella britannica]
MIASNIGKWATCPTLPGHVVEPNVKVPAAAPIHLLDPTDLPSDDLLHSDGATATIVPVRNARAPESWSAPRFFTNRSVTHRLQFSINLAVWSHVNGTVQRVFSAPIRTTSAEPAQVLDALFCTFPRLEGEASAKDVMVYIAVAWSDLSMTIADISGSDQFVVRLPWRPATVLAPLPGHGLILVPEDQRRSDASVLALTGHPLLPLAPIAAVLGPNVREPLHLRSGESILLVTDTLLVTATPAMATGQPGSLTIARLHAVEPAHALTDLLASEIELMAADAALTWSPGAAPTSPGSFFASSRVPAWSPVPAPPLSPSLTPSVARTGRLPHRRSRRPGARPSGSGLAGDGGNNSTTPTAVMGPPIPDATTTLSRQTTTLGSNSTSTSILRDGLVHGVLDPRASAATLAAVPAISRQMSPAPIQAIACETASGAACVALVFPGETVKIAQLAHQQPNQPPGAKGKGSILARQWVRRHVRSIVTIEMWGGRTHLLMLVRQPASQMPGAAAAAVAGPGVTTLHETPRWMLWSGLEHDIPVSIGQGGNEEMASVRSLAPGPFPHSVLARNRAHTACMLAKVMHSRWDVGGPESAPLQLLHVIAHILDPDSLVRLRTAPVITPIATALVQAVEGRTSLVAASVQAMWLLHEEWSLSPLRRTDAHGLSKILLHLCVQLGWTWHADFLLSRDPTLVKLSVAHLERLADATVEPHPPISSIFMWALAPAATTWPTLDDIARTLPHDVIPAPPTNHATSPLFPLTGVFVQLASHLRATAATSLDGILGSDIDHALAKLLHMWKTCPGEFSSMDPPLKVLVLAMIQIARSRLYESGSEVPDEVARFLNRRDLGGAGTAPTTRATDRALTNVDGSPGLVDASSIAIASDLLTLPSETALAYVREYVGGAEHWVEEETGRMTAMAVTRFAAGCVGGAALRFRTRSAATAGPPTIPAPTATVVHYVDQLGERTGEASMTLSWTVVGSNEVWAGFHRGVEAALASPVPAGFDVVAWLWESRLPIADRPWPAEYSGFVFGLGLQGHLRRATPELLRYLLFVTSSMGANEQWHHHPSEVMDAVVLLGLGASHIGTAEHNVYAVSGIYVPEAFDVPGSHIRQPLQVQMAAFIAIGMLHVGHSNPAVVRAMLRGIDVGHRDDPSAAGDPFFGDGVRVSAALGLAFAGLGRGAAMAEWCDADLWAALHARTDLDLAASAATAVPAWIALGWIYFDCQFALLAAVVYNRLADIPPIQAFFRAVAAHLTGWSAVDCDWAVREHARIPRTAPLVARMALITAIDYVLALKLAGTNHSAPLQILDRDYQFISDIAEGSGEWGKNPEWGAQSLALDWAHMLLLGKALITAGHGDLATVQRAAMLYHTCGPTVRYSHKIMTSAALGLALCGNGMSSVSSRTPVAALALFCATMPILPSATSDHVSASHPISHFWVLAARYNVLEARDVGTGDVVRVSAMIEPGIYQDSTTSDQKPRRIDLPCHLSLAIGRWNNGTGNGGGRIVVDQSPRYFPAAMPLSEIDNRSSHEWTQPSQHAGGQVVWLQRRCDAVPKKDDGDAARLPWDAHTEVRALMDQIVRRCCSPSTLTPALAGTARLLTTLGAPLLRAVGLDHALVQLAGVHDAAVLATSHTALSGDTEMGDAYHHIAVPDDPTLRVAHAQRLYLTDTCASSVLDLQARVEAAVLSPAFESDDPHECEQVAHLLIDMLLTMSVDTT